MKIGWKTYNTDCLGAIYRLTSRQRLYDLSHVTNSLYMLVWALALLYQMVKTLIVHLRFVSYGNNSIDARNMQCASYRVPWISSCRMERS